MMSDSFADLWASTTPSNPPTLASTPHPNTTSTPPLPKPKPTYDKSDLLIHFALVFLINRHWWFLPFAPYTQIRKIHALHVGGTVFTIRCIDSRRPQRRGRV
jgi:hypothetical protein